MPQVLSNIGGIFTGGGNNGGDNGGEGALSKIAPFASIGAGFLGNWLANRHYNSVQDAYMNLLKNYRNLSPAEVSAGIRSMVQPLNMGLQQSVGNAVQGQLASRGLSQAPGIYEATLAQALAPYAQQNLQNAQQAYFQMKGLPLNVQFPWGSVQRPQPFDISGAIQNIMNGAGDPGLTLHLPGTPSMPDPTPPFAGWPTGVIPGLPPAAGPFNGGSPAFDPTNWGAGGIG